MKLNSLSALPLSAVLLFAASSQAHADWVQSSDPVVVTPGPANMELQAQNPPTFKWARYSSTTPSYTLVIKSGTTVVQTYTTTRNWYLPTTALPLGTYTWQVAPTGTTTWSLPRTFIIDSSAQVFQLPDNATLRAAIVATPRPRGLQRGLPLFSSWGTAIKAERLNAYNKLYADVSWGITSVAPVSDALWPLDTTGTPLSSAQVAQMNSVRAAIYANGRQLEGATLMYRLSGEVKFLNEALLRGDAMAALSATGPTSYAQQDQGCRVITLALLRAIDGLGANVSGNRRAAWLNSVTLRTTDIYNDLSGSNGRMDQYPFDSHGGTNLGFLALISTLALGDIPAADTWFDFSFRAYAASFSAWSGPEGGFANGSAYAQYTADLAQQIWQPMQQATGVNMFNKPWSAGFLRYFMHFVPPGATRHVFGDENEVPPTFYVLKGYAAHYPTPAANWYYSHIPGEMDALTLLQAPWPLPVNQATSVAPPANAGLYPSIGWVAMHSDMSSNLRTSLYFKASPYGSYNHSHGEQNSIVLHSAGVPLLPQSGFEDYYGSLLWSTWYRQTKAHNAITYDGGQGQAVDGYTSAGYTRTLAYTGKVTAFSTSATRDYAEGDATVTYSGVLSKAVRKIWYLRNIDAAVVMDTLAAPAAHVFEWNFHTLAPITADAQGNTSVTYMNRSLCIRPINTTGIHFEKRSFPPPKTGVEDYGVYANNSAVLSTEFLMLLDVGCKKPTVTLTTTSTGRTLQVGTETITLPK